MDKNEEFISKRERLLSFTFFKAFNGTPKLLKDIFAHLVKMPFLSCQLQCIHFMFIPRIVCNRRIKRRLQEGRILGFIFDGDPYFGCYEFKFLFHGDVKNYC